MEVDDNNISIDHVCRLCRASKGLMAYIFNYVDLEPLVPLSTIIMNFTNVKVFEGDGLPTLICHRCLYHLEIFLEFKQICKQSDNYFRQVISQQNDCSNYYNENEYLLNNSINDASAKVKGNVTTEGDNEKGEVLVLNETQNGENEETQKTDGPDSDMNCPSCNKLFDDRDKLNRHMNIHSQEGPFPCDYCDLEFSDKSSLKSHWRNNHSLNKPYMCLTCGLAFRLKDDLNEHNALHDKVKPFHCDVPFCNRAFTYRSDLRKHAVIHTGIRPYVCPICCKSFTRSTNLNKHARLHSGKRPFGCTLCEKVFASRGDLLRHTVIHSGQKPFKCSTCTLSFNRKDKLSRHEKLHIGERAHPCPRCPTSFNRKEELTKHIQYHHYEKIDDSPTVSDETKADLIESDSVENENSQETEINLDMPEIEIIIRKDNTKTEHNAVIKPNKESNRSSRVRKMKSREINFLKSPNRKIKEPEDLVVTIDPTNWEPVHSCDFCQKTFTDLEKLDKHHSMHERNMRKPFICQTCSKQFGQERDLIRHIRTHTGYKPYKCQECDKAFSRKDKLSDHVRTHIFNELKKDFKELLHKT